MRLPLKGGSPDEDGEFAGHGGGRDVAVLAAADELAEGVLQSDPGAPGNAPDGGIDVTGTRFDDARDLGLRNVRCKICGIVTHWEPLNPEPPRSPWSEPA